MTFHEHVMSCHGMSCLLVTCFWNWLLLFSEAVSCDHGIESGARKDRCGICGGIGDTCVLVNSTYTKDHREYGKRIMWRWRSHFSGDTSALTYRTSAKWFTEQKRLFLRIWQTDQWRKWLVAKHREPTSWVDSLWEPLLFGKTIAIRSSF